MKHYIYKITNNINGKYYIGVTVDPKRRKQQHFSSHRGEVYSIHRAISKYGKENFSFDIIEECLTEDEAYEREAELIADNPGSYNTAGRRGGFASEEHRRKVVQQMTNNNPMKTPEAIAKVSFTMKEKWRKGEVPAFTEERNKKISESKLGKLNPNFGNPSASKHLNDAPPVVCEKCGMSMNKSNYVRWHGDNCKPRIRR